MTGMDDTELSDPRSELAALSQEVEALAELDPADTAARSAAIAERLARLLEQVSVGEATSQEDA